jgi:2-(1,2-epoxy-1,2-dihydrophenyl)acetyl-CoA isomerase
MQIDTGTETVQAERSDGVGIITLNRPERRNALHPEMYEAVPRLLEGFIDDPEVGCILITGAGSSFCSGGDVSAAQRRTRTEATEDGATSSPARPVEEQGRMLAHNARMVQRLHESPKITVAALPGAAVGAGMSIALAADFRIAAESATLIPGWSRLAFSGDFGGTWFLTRLVGPSRALELLIGNTTIDASLALSLGLVNRVVPDQEFRSASLAWATAIAAGPRTAYASFKANVLQAERLTLSEALPFESERMARSALTEDHRLAVKRWMQEAADKRATRR